MESGISRDLFYGRSPRKFSEITEGKTHRVVGSIIGTRTLRWAELCFILATLKTPQIFWAMQCNLELPPFWWGGGEGTVFYPEGRVTCVPPEPG